MTISKFWAFMDNCLIPYARIKFSDGSVRVGWINRLDCFHASLTYHDSTYTKCEMRLVPSKIRSIEELHF